MTQGSATPSLVIHDWPKGEADDIERFTPCGVDIKQAPPNHRVTFLPGEVNCETCKAVVRECPA